MKFNEFTLHPDILKGLEQAGFTDCTECQAKTLTQVLQNGRDVTVQSQTGTGKTAAFLISIFQLLLENPDFKGRKALIVAPTRELAVQICEEAKVLGTHVHLKSGAVYGGVGYGQQEEMLKAGIDLVVGTPGRVLDFISGKKINPKDFSIVVIDEADRLLDMGFYPDIKKLLGKMVAPEFRRTMLLSATMSTRVSNIAWEHMADPADIVITSDRVTVDAIEQRLFHVSSDEKMRLLLGLLIAEKPANALVFTNTKRKAEEVAKRLEINGYPAHFIMGDLPQKKRLAIINEVKAGKVSYLVATDVAARGLHIDDLDMVFNFDLPEDAENYVHRIGRTARAGKTGKAVSMACEKFVYALAGIEKYINMKIPVAPVTDEMLAVDKSQGMRIHLSTWDDDGNEIEGAPSRGYGDRGRGAPRRNDRNGRPERDRQGPSRGPREHENRDRPKTREGQTSARPATPAPRMFPSAANAAVQKQAAAKPVQRGQSAEERLAYYRQKYGESFIPTPELLERLRRDEQRAKEKGQRVSRTPGSHGQKPSQNRESGRSNQARDNRNGPGQNERAPRPSTGRSQNPKNPARTATPIAVSPAVPETKKKRSGILEWVSGLLRGTKRP